MKLMTKELSIRLKEYPIGKNEGSLDKAGDNTVVVKYFNPYGAGTWLVTEANLLENGDYEMYGLCHIQTWEWGYFNLSQLQEIQIKFNGMVLGGIERDLSVEKYNPTIRECVEELGSDYDTEFAIKKHKSNEKELEY